MLRDVVASFLDSLTEREFDGPLLALLSAQGFTDIHLTHGGFEFGKDVIARKRDPDGYERQYAIQSKAGDINQRSWREVRPQLEECEYNTRSHPGYDGQLPRVAVLVTTGRLTGAAPVDAQEYRNQAASRGLADVEFWDRETLLDWICSEPSIGLSGAAEQDRLLAVVNKINSEALTEPELERYSRHWLSGGGAIAPARVAIEAAVIANRLRATRRLDLAAATALFLLRAAWSVTSLPHGGTDLPPLVESAVRLFRSYAEELLGQAERLIDDPKGLLAELFDAMAIVSYPAACIRLAEVIGLLALCCKGVDQGVQDRATAVVEKLLTQHPGTSRPPSDLFAASIIPPVIVVGRGEPSLAIGFTREVARWLLDRHDSEKAGLGIASLDESDEIAVERLLGGSLSATELDIRRSSHLATVVMDLLIILEAKELYEGVRENLRALRVVPETTAADEALAAWRRGGDDVWPQPRVDYLGWEAPRPSHHTHEMGVPAVQAILLGSACRSRHAVTAMKTLLDASLNLDASA